MNDNEIELSSFKLLSVINVITGWVFPPDEDLQEILQQQFKLKITDSYGKCNLEEIAYAFRSNNEIKEWGKTININLIDEVMAPYLQKRFELSNIEERTKEIPVQKIYTDEELETLRLKVLNQYRAQIETYFQQRRQGKFPLLHWYWLNVLKEDGLLIDGIDENSKYWMENLEEFFVRRLATTENIYINNLK